MEPVVGKIKDLAKSTQDFFDGVFYNRTNSSRRHPVEILKRLQRETFSDLMKVRERQDKLERVVSFQKIKGSPFRDAGTHVRGEIDTLGVVLMTGDVDQLHNHILGQAGMNGGVRSKISFEAPIREKDTLIAEFVTGLNPTGHNGDILGSTLSLSKVLFASHLCDWVSATFMPVGAQFRHLGFTTDSSNQVKGLTELSAIGPPLMNEHNGSAIGVTVRKSNFTSSLAHSLTGLRKTSLYSHGSDHCFNTFGQIVCELPKGVKLSVLGVHKQPQSSRRFLHQGAVVLPVGILKRLDSPPFQTEQLAPPLEADLFETTPTGSIAVKLESRFDESTRMESWIQRNNSTPNLVQWAVNAIDDSEDELGWGMSIGGTVDSQASSSRFQAESYLKLNLGKKFCLKPGVAYAGDSNSKVFGLMLRSNWSF
ncbi:hypothetical protein LINPERPRIM_LOCUS29587 [Linum perenne]